MIVDTLFAPFKNHCRTLLLLCLIPAVSLAQASEQVTISLSGRIVSPQSQPIAQAEVRLENTGLVATTQSDGRFSFSQTVQTKQNSIRQGVPQPKGGLHFAISRAGASVDFEIRTLQNRLVESKTMNLQPGEYSVDPRRVFHHGFASGVYAVVVRTSEGIEKTALQIQSPYAFASNTGVTTQKINKTAISKQFADPTVNLVVTAQGYALYSQVVQAQAGDLGDIVLSTAESFVPGHDPISTEKQQRVTDQPEGVPAYDQVGINDGAGIPDLSGTQNVVASEHGVTGGDQTDDTQALQSILDELAARSDTDKLVTVLLPQGDVIITKEIVVEADNVVIRGKGSDPEAASFTRVVYRPDQTMRYDKIDNEGVPDLQAMSHNGNSYGWNWPGRGLFRVQTREVSPNYTDDYEEAPQNRKDIYEGSINFHWASGFNVDQDQDFPAREGDTRIQLDDRYDNGDMQAFSPGTFVWVGAANSEKMYQQQHVPEKYWERLHMKIQIFRVVSVNTSNRTIEIDAPLEFDLPANSASDGSTPIGSSKPYPSRVVPLKMVENVGFEDMFITMDINGLEKLGGGTYNYTPEQAMHNYGNMAPEYAMHGIVFKWAANSWVKNVHLFMSGSHPVVTEQVYAIELTNNILEGSWNKGGGGNGYLRLSRAWQCLVYNNVLRGLRHLTLQWSASGNVIIGNDMDCEVNLHGGWERHNLVELNRIKIPYEHAHTTCNIGCDHIVDGGVEHGTWFPIYWATGEKAGKWSGATGPRNIFFNNIMKKQTTPGGPYVDYEPYYRSDGSSNGRVFIFGWDRQTKNGSHWVHLEKNGEILSDWATNEQIDYSRDPHRGVNAELEYKGSSLFLKDAPLPFDG